MKVSVARGELLEALSAVSKGLSTRTTLPILSGIHISTRDGSLVLQSTDLEISIKTKTKARIEDAGQTVLPGKLLTDIVRSLPEAAVTIDTSSTGSAIVTCGQSSFTVKTLSPEDFPKFPVISTDEMISLPSSSFSKIVHQVSKAVSRDETRPILTGILVVIEEGMLRMVATDSYRLCLRETTIEGVAGSLEVVIPGRGIEDVARLAASSEQVSLGVSDNQVIFQFGETVFISRRIEGSFPNYRQLIPKDHQTRVVIDRAEFSEAVKRVSLLAQHNAPLRVAVNTADHILTLTAQTQDVGEAKEDIEISPVGEDVEIAFNHTYLMDGISVAEGEKIAIEIVSPLKPGILKSVDNSEFIYLLMPVRLG
ncbi:MAG: DNA polymerase III subunit beta [Coriobacteriia bacterium]|nr:DNA polymerase III subunit beta [Coriobacteriia bacterium]